MLNWFIGLAIRMQMWLGGLMDGFSKCAGGLAGCILSDGGNKCGEVS